MYMKCPDSLKQHVEVYKWCTGPTPDGQAAELDVLVYEKRHRRVSSWIGHFRSSAGEAGAGFVPYHSTKEKRFVSTSIRWVRVLKKWFDHSLDWFNDMISIFPWEWLGSIIRRYCICSIIWPTRHDILKTWKNVAWSATWWCVKRKGSCCYNGGNGICCRVGYHCSFLHECCSIKKSEEI